MFGQGGQSTSLSSAIAILPYGDNNEDAELEDTIDMAKKSTDSPVATTMPVTLVEEIDQVDGEGGNEGAKDESDKVS